MSHHYSGPDFGFPHGDARLDLTDLYAFPKPGDATKSILIMNVHPSTSYNPPGPTDPFSTEALYEFKIDTDGDAVADLTYQGQFSAAAGGAQIAALRRVESARQGAWPSALSRARSLRLSERSARPLTAKANGTSAGFQREGQNKEVVLWRSCSAFCRVRSHAVECYCLSYTSISGSGLTSGPILVVVTVIVLPSGESSQVLLFARTPSRLPVTSIV
jgi:hypothetical protein